jgi:hypothetical protein
MATAVTANAAHASPEYVQNPEALTLSYGDSGSIQPACGGRRARGDLA